MSSPSTIFRLFYPATNTLTAVSLFDATGATLTSQTMADGADNPAGFQSKVLTFTAASEPLFATPTFSDPNSPVSLYLCRDDAGTFQKVLDETVFNPAEPGRPTPAVTAAQEFRLYTATDLGGGIKTYTVKAPVSPVALVKALGKDPLTGDLRLGNDILLRWNGDVATAAEVEADIEDITDPRGYLPFPIINRTTYAESSVGLSLVQVTDQIVPQDGLTHLVKFRIRYNVNGDTGAWAETSNAMLTYPLPLPNPPVSLTAQLLRDRVDTIPDVVKVTWAKAADNPGDGLEIVVYDPLNKKHTIYSSNGLETEARIDNLSRFSVQDTGPALAQPYRFAIVATNLSGKSEETFAAAPLQITSKVKPVAPPTPDEVAGTARDLTTATLKAEVFSDVLTAMGTLPAEASAIVNSVIDQVEDLIARFFRSASLLKPSAHYLALFNTLPDEANQQGVEVSGGGYARLRYGPADANWSAPSNGNGELRNLIAVTFGAPTTDWHTVVGFGLYDALAGGNALILAPLETPLLVKAGDPPPVFTPGDLVITIG